MKRKLLLILIAVFASIYSYGQYCTASGGGGEYISGVEIGTINNTGTGEDGYHDYTALSTDLYQGQTNVSITITNGDSWNSDDVGVWVDWNQDSDFDDVDENVVCENDNGGEGTFTFDVPAGATIGNTVMRVRIKYTGSDCGIPCDVTTYGEVEDYTINVTAPAACPAPSAQTESNITSSSADLAWTENGSAAQWNIEYGPTGFTQGAGTTISGVTANPYTLSGLSSSTTYDWYVQADCGSGSTSDWTGPSTFTTQCNAISSFPYSEDFATWPPSCWTINKSITGSTDEWIGYTSGGVECAKANFWNQPGGHTDIMYTPTFDVSGLTTPSFYFKWSHKYNPSYPNDSLSVEVSNDNGATWHQVWTKGGSNLYSNDGAENTAPGTFATTSDIDLSAYGTTIIIRFFATSGYGPDLFIDDVVVREMPSCPDPTAQTESNITSTSVDLGWTENGSATQWNIEYGPTGFVQGTGTTIPGVTSNPYTLSGLSGSTTYDWYVQADCGSGSTSGWTGPSTFTTEVTPNLVSTFPYNESFESGFGQWKQMQSDDFDWDTLVGATPSSSTGPSAAYSGTHYAYTESSSPNYPSKTAGLILAFDVSTLTTPQLTFAYHMYGAAMGTLQVEASTDSGSTWDTVWSKTGNQGNQWNTATVSLSSYAGSSNLYLKFWGKTGTSFFSDMAIDTVDMREAPSCPDPSNQTESNITSSSADLEWTTGGSSQWQIEWDTAGFTQGTGTRIITNSNPYTLTGLSSSTSYSWYVRDICGAGDSSVWRGPHTFTTVPVNDDCPNAVALTVGYDTTYTEGTNVNATESNNNPDPIPTPLCANYSGGDVWYTAVVPASGYLTVTSRKVAGSSFTDSGMGIYLGTCGSLTLLECDDDDSPDGYMSQITLNADSLANETVYIRFWEYGNNSFGPFEIAAFTHPTAAVWDGSTDANWFDKTNWDVNGVPGANTVVTIPTGVTNYPTLTAASTIDSLIIESDATGDASILGDNNLIVNTNATVQRYTTVSVWHDFSAPVQGQTLDALYLGGSPNVWITHYNEVDNSRTYMTALTDPLDPGAGYELWIGGPSAVTYNFTGALNRNDVALSTATTPALSFTGPDPLGYNLIGNPFASPIALDSGNWNMANVDSTFWVWSGTYKDYNTITKTGSLSNGIIPMGQGFFIHANAANPTITIPVAARVHSSQPYYKSTRSNSLDMMKLRAMFDNDKYDELNILFINGAKETFESRDTRKMFAFNGTVPQVYATIPDDELSQNSLPALNPGDKRTVAVGYKAGVNGNQILVADLSSLPKTDVVLEDLKLNKFQNLNTNPIYTFEATTYQNPDRFRLHFNRSVTGIDDNLVNSAIRAYSFEKNVYILSNKELSKQKKELTIYDMMGRTILNKILPPGDIIRVPVNASNAYVVVRVISKGEVYTTKVFIK